MSNDKQNDFQKDAISSAPKWAISICGIILALSLSLKLADINVSDPLNRYFNAVATVMEEEAKSSLGSTSQLLLEETVQRVDELEKTSEKLVEVQDELKKVQTTLKEVAHKPKGELIYK
ncbi:coil containing protein [Vibrio phage 1.101.O._10N.261.45.C6]|nr:coil containing protein [Vibrio phage 1.101.O._10N.261.45.C6]